MKVAVEVTKQFAGETKKSKFPVDARNDAANIATPQLKSGFAQTSEWLLKLLGLQIELNLVPTVIGLRNADHSFTAGLDIEFFDALKLQGNDL